MPSLLRKGNLSRRSSPCILFVHIDLLSGNQCALLVLGNSLNPLTVFKQPSIVLSSSFSFFFFNLLPPYSSDYLLIVLQNNRLIINYS